MTVKAALRQRMGMRVGARRSAGGGAGGPERGSGAAGGAWRVRMLQPPSAYQGGGVQGKPRAPFLKHTLGGQSLGEGTGRERAHQTGWVSMPAAAGGSWMAAGGTQCC